MGKTIKPQQPILPQSGPESMPPYLEAGFLLVNNSWASLGLYNINF